MLYPLAAAARGRWAVATMFLVNGFLVGSWAPQIPSVLTRLEITESTLGLLILCFGLGALSSMPWSGYLMAKHGTRNVLRFFASIATLGLLAVALAPNVWLAAVALGLFGGMIGTMDVAMNANAVVVERKLTRAIMSSSHGFWSLGGFAGGGAGGIIIQNFGHLQHAALVTVIAIAAVACALPHLIAEDRPVAHEHAKFALPRTAIVYLIGLIALCVMVPEGAVLDWAALYLQQELGSDLAIAGFAFAGFSGTMATMRFLGDGVRSRFGAVQTFRISGVIAAASMLAAALSPWPWLAIAAFACCGLGIANMVPIAFSAGGNQSGMASGTGMAIVTTMGYSGILLAPSAIGFAAERTGFGPVFIALSGLLFVVCLMAPLVRAADLPKISS
ncbi:MFS transporter [Bradyrhizobium sp. LHD-71]|uniref:MFS transporter n=1 Tax=Bradyrhizobium sp. LHD-71 TaxID=3072141 RepID=UPI00280F3AA3|nr:MFS transporter [Bradyrhizobium sp. LHD-71]MDQ8726488.1 MFS transporter [Bradyrhizobium sp. LHD-71]